MTWCTRRRPARLLWLYSSWLGPRHGGGGLPSYVCSAQGWGRFNGQGFARRAIGEQFRVEIRRVEACDGGVEEESAGLSSGAVWHAATDESLDVEAVTEVDWIDQLGTRAAVAPPPSTNLAISAQNAGACRFGSYRFGEGVALEIDR